MKLLKILLAIVVLVGALGAVGVFYGDGLAKGLIEDSGTESLGVATTLDDVKLGLFSGEFGMSGMRIANPDGFEAKHMLELGSATLDVAGRELMSDPITVGRFVLSDITLNLEQGLSGSNFGKVIDHIKKNSGGSEPSEPEGEPKRMRIKEILIKNVTVNAKVLGASVSGSIPELRLENLGTGDNQALQLGEVATGVLQALLAATLEADLNLPEALNSALGQGLGDLQGLKIAGLESLDALGKNALEKAGMKVNEILGEGAKKLGEGGNKILDEAKKKLPGGLGGLLGGDGK